jgi:hypothetical protein
MGFVPDHEKPATPFNTQANSPSRLPFERQYAHPTEGITMTIFKWFTSRTNGLFLNLVHLTIYIGLSVMVTILNKIILLHVSDLC